MALTGATSVNVISRKTPIILTENTNATSCWAWLYKQSVIGQDEKTVYGIDELQAIHSVIEKFIFFVQPKWKIATDFPGSGNTRSIGGETNIEKLVKGEGTFARYGEDIFDDYWMNYYNAVDAEHAGMGKPNYSNLETYIEYLRSQGRRSKVFDKEA